MGQENLSGTEIAAVWIGSLLALAGFINTLGSAWEKLNRAIGAAVAMLLIFSLRILATVYKWNLPKA